MKNSFFKRIGSILESLTSKPRLGGFQITDSSLRYLNFQENGTPRTFMVKLPPGVVVDGKVQDEEKFLYHLKQLHGLILPEEPEEQIKTVVCLPSVVTYTQNYDVPNVGREWLEETAKLNLETISPVPAEEAYMSWQLVKETEDKFEILGAFAESKVVDKFRDLLRQAGFSPMIFEFPSLSLSWTMNNEFGPRPESFLILNVSGDGIDLFLLRNGSIYFDYFRSWRSIQGKKREISREDFDNVLVEEIRKVANFTSSRFSEGLKYIFVLAPGMEKEIESLIERNFQVQAAPLQIGVKPLDSSWYTVMGSAVRGNWNRAGDRYISLGTYKVRELFFREQAMDFVRLWQNTLAGIIAVFLIIMFGSYILLNTQPKTLEERLKIFDVSFEAEEIAGLTESVEEFNFLTGGVARIKEGSGRITGILDSVKDLTDENGIGIDIISLSKADGPIHMTAKAPSYERVIEFKNVLVKDPRFTSVDVPFSKIFTSEENFVVFDISFRYGGEPEE